MFKKIHILIFAVLTFALLDAGITQAQPTKTKGDVYPVFSIAILGGAQFPVAGLNDTYNPSFNAGLDLNLKVNRETSFYLNGTYYAFPRKGEILPGGDASYISITAGPRYIFTSRAIKAQFFLEAGLGVYMFNVKEYTAGTPSVTYPSTSNTQFGVNVGPGVIIPLGKAMDLLIKTKLHYTFETGGSHTFVSAAMGLAFKL